MEWVPPSTCQTPREVEQRADVVEVAAATALELALLADSTTAYAGDGSSDTSCRKTNHAENEVQ